MSSFGRKQRRAARAQFGPLVTEKDPKERLRRRLEQSVAEFGAAGGAVGEAATLLLRGAASCALMAGWERALFVQTAKGVMTQEQEAFNAMVSKGGKA